MRTKWQQSNIGATSVKSLKTETGRSSSNWKWKIFKMKVDLQTECDPCAIVFNVERDLTQVRDIGQGVAY